MPTLINFYRNDSDKRTLNKKLQNVMQNVACTITDNEDVLNPILIANYNPQYIKANYCAIPEWGRYYFCRLELLTGNMCAIHCEVDPLMSWRNYISQIRCTILRQEFLNSPYITDDKYTCRVDRNIDRYVVGDVMAASGYYLTVNGGGQEN